jgi:Tol biopolymer transport system component
MGKLYEELKRRKVFRTALIYAVVAWVLLQVADTIAPMMNLPDSAPRLVLFLLIILFPIAVFLAWAYEVTPEGISSDPGTQTQAQAPAPQNQLLIYAIFGLVLLVAGFQLSDRFLSGNATTATRSVETALSTTDSAGLRASIILDQSLSDAGLVGLRTQLDIAPDGSALAYTDIEQGKIFLRDLVTQQTQEILPSAGLSVFSPNGQQLLITDGQFNSSIMGAQGSGLRPLPIEAWPPSSWLSDEAIIHRDTEGMNIFSLTNREDVLIPGFDNSAGPANPFALPNDSAFLFHLSQSLGAIINPRILAYDLSNQNTKLVTNDGYFPQYVNSGHVVFTRDGDLWAVPFDPDTLEVTGAEIVVLKGVDSGPSLGIAAYAVSNAGRLVYLPSREFLTDQTVLVWADRLGNRTELSLRAGNYEEPRLSPNGELLALTSIQPDGSSDIWVHEFSNGNFNPVTFTGTTSNPVWTPDGSQLVYQQNTTGGISPRGELWIMNANGTGQAERILDVPARADSFSPIDEKLIYMTGDALLTSVNLSTLTKSDDTWVLAPLFHTENNKFNARVSPDGRWIAYGDSDGGVLEWQIYVQPYPNLEGGRWQISSDAIGNREPSWGPNGDELFFLRNDGSLMHAEITIVGDGFSSGVPLPLFAEVQLGLNSPSYAASNDGERFLHSYSADDEGNAGLDQDQAELIVVENWFAELRRLAPADPQ